MIRARALVLLSLAGCQPLAAPIVDTSERDAIAALDARVTALAESVSGVEQALTAATAESQALATEVTEHSKALGRVETALVDMPGRLKDVCPSSPAPTHTECPASEQRVPVSGDKLVVGMRERVLVDPPATQLVARIDTSLLGNSIYVTDVVEFQRDGDNWVRFRIAVPGEPELREVERPLRKKSSKTADTEDAPRVVQLRVSLGDVTDSYDFTLVQRTPKDYQLRLGRSFLRDVALVDVSRRFVQPPATAQKGES